MLLAAWAPGCAAAEPVGGERDGTALLERTQRWEPIAGARLLPFEEHTSTVRVLEGPGEGGTLTQRMAEDEDGDRWLLTVDGRQRVHLELGEAGEVLVVREDDFEQNVAVHYEPALVLLPATLERDAVHEQTVEVTVRRLDRGTVRDRGSCDYRLEVGGVGPLNVEAGQLRGYALRQQRELDLNLAQASVAIETVYVPEMGRAAWRVDRHTRALGVWTSRRQSAYELVEEGEPEAEAGGEREAEAGSANR